MRKFVLVDYMHLVFKCMVAQPLSTVKKINGVMEVIDTTIPSITIKNIVKYGGNGKYYTGVFLEGGSSRKDIDSNYKSNRKSNPMYSGANLAINLMNMGGVSLYRKKGLEADDLICAMVYKLRREYPDAYIDVITGDADLLSLVDEKCSVWMRGSRQFAVNKAEERRLYYQVTPDTWEDYMEGTSAYGGYGVPYNAIMLFKMIKGDKSDNIEMAIKGYGKVKFSKLINQMAQDGVDFSKVFRNHCDFDNDIAPVLSKYFNDEEMLRLKKNHSLLRMNTTQQMMRPSQIDIGRLQPVLLDVDIHLNV